MSVEIENLKKDVRMRAEADPMMSTAWILLYLLPVIAVIGGILTFFLSITIFSVERGTYLPGEPTYPLGFPFVPVLAGGVVLLVLLGIIGFIVSIILRYKLVKRRNTHFKRQIFLLEDSIGIVRSIATKKEMDVEAVLSSCERTLREARSEETEKSAMLWAILSAIPWIGTLAEWYVSYFLMKDFYKHERREDGFWEDLKKVLDKGVVTFSLPRRTEIIPNRSFVLYLILSIITLGLFGIYWLYVLLKDPNEHFKYHVQVEDELLSALESVTI